MHGLCWSRDFAYRFQNCNRAWLEFCSLFALGGIFFSFLPPFLPQMASRGGRPLSAGRPLSGSKEKPGDIRHRRDKVLVKYQEFTDAVHSRRLKLEQAKQLHHFYTDADNLESWINDKIRIASDESYKDRRNLQARKYIATTILIAVVLYAKQYCTYIFIITFLFLLFFCRLRYRSISLLKLRLLHTLRP